MNVASNDTSVLTGTWKLDTERTSIQFRTKAMWVLPVKGSFKATSGSGSVSEDGSVSGTLVLDAASIATGMSKRDDHLRTADFLDVAQYPTITYTATGASDAGNGRYKVSGELTVAGNSRPLDLVAEVKVDGTTATITSEFDIDRSGWGISWTKMGAGLVNHATVTATFTKS